MKKLLLCLTAFLWVVNFSFSQVVDYYVTAIDLIGMSVSGDQCFPPNVEYKQTSLGNTWGFQWTSTNAAMPSSITIDYISNSEEAAGPYPTTLNGFANNAVSPAASSCSVLSQVFVIDPTNYNPLGLNTFLMDYTAATTTSAQMFPAGPFYAHIAVNYSAACSDPDVPTLSALPNPVCPGSNANISITGNLNSATKWYIYTGSCNGTILDSTALATFSVSPASTTTYYIRGEGGCVTPGACGSVTVTVEDTQAPVPDLGSLPAVNAECSANPTAPTALDNCAGPVTGTPDVTLPITAQGTTTITWTYDDGNGNTSTQLQLVTLDDGTDPVPLVTPLPDINEECTSTPIAPDANDNCAGVILATPDVTFPITTQGTTVVTWTYDDGNGNTATQMQNVIIDDITAPVPDNLTLSDVNGECTAAPSAPTATDNCVGSVTGTPDVTFPITAQGTTVVTWTYDDGNGNTSTQVQNVILNDITSPVPDVGTLPGINEECSSTPTAPTATDNCAGSVTGTPDVTFPITAQGTTVVTWTYDDGNGNTTTQTQNVVIDDVTDPVISQCPGNSTLNADNAGCTSQVIWLEPIATDNCSTVTMTPDISSGSTFNLGTTTVTYTATDGAGNTATCQFDITIVSDLSATATTVTDVDCFGAMNGAIDVDITGSGSPYSYDWNSGTYSTEDLTGLGPGTYDLTVTDNFDCTDMVSVTITEPSQITVTIDATQNPTSCGASDGSIFVTSGGGTAPLSYDWNSGAFTTEDLSGLPAGAYALTVTDNNGCTSMVDTVLSDPGAPTVTIGSFTDATCNGDMDGAIDIDVTGGTAPYTFDWNSGTYTSEDLTGLGAGSYSVVVTDNAGCSASIAQNISEPAAIDTSVNQAGSDLASNATGGVTYQWIDCSTMNPLSGETNATYNATANGSYAVIVTDGPCSDTSACYTVGGIGFGENTFDLSVYPNPTDDQLFVVLSGYTGNVSLDILDISGKLVKDQTVMNIQSGNQISIDVSELEKGSYLLRLQIENTIEKTLFIVH